MYKKRLRLAAIAGFPVFILCIVFVVATFGEDLVSLFRNRAELREWIGERGAAGYVVFVLLQILQVVVFVLPGDIVQLAGGFVFGTVRGVILTVVGIGIGSLFNYAVGRWLGRPFVEAVVSRDRLASIDRVVSDRRTVIGYFILFAIPGLPKDALCYVAGASRFPLGLFMLASMTSRLPGIAGSSLMGSSVYDGDLALAIGVFSVAAVFLVLGLVFRDTIAAWLERRFGSGGGGRP